jgi:hypothetical protein
VNSYSFDFELFGYSWKDRLQDYRILFIILVSCLLFIGILSSLVGWFVFLFSLSTKVSALDHLLEAIIGLPIALLVFYPMAHLIFNLFPAIRINQGGMEVQVFENFHYIWKLVSWEAIRALYPIVKFGWLYDQTGRCIYLLEIDNLSIWHRQLSVIFGNGDNQAIVFNRNFPKREGLLDKIRNHLPAEKTA